MKRHPGHKTPSEKIFFIAGVTLEILKSSIWR